MGTVTMETLPLENFTTRYYRKSRDGSVSPSPLRVRRKQPATMQEDCEAYNIPYPLQNIGCQDLLECKYSHSGWLRKRRNLLTQLFNWPQAYVVLYDGCLYYFKNEKAKSASGKFSLYGYNSISNEESENQGVLYQRLRNLKVFRASEVSRKEAPWAFKIVHSHTEFKTYFFAASSEQEMKLWMSCVKKEMLQANGKSSTYGVKLAKEKEEVDGRQDDSSFYQDIETNIYDGVHTFVPSQDYQKQCSIKKQNEESDDEDLIDKRPPLPLPVDKDPFCSYRKSIDVSEINPPHTLDSAAASRLAPPTPPRHRHVAVKLEDGSSSPKTKVKGLTADIEKATKTKKTHPRLNRRGSYEKTDLEIVDSIPHVEHHVDFTQMNISGGGSTGEDEQTCDLEEYWASIYFDDNDKYRAHDILTEIADEGVYLVRPEGSGTGKVLVVWAQGKAKKYRIQISPDGDYFLSNAGFHDKCLENVLCYYYEQDLPTVQTKLKMPYKLHPHYKKLRL